MTRAATRKAALPVPEPTTVAEAWGRDTPQVNLLDGRPVLLTRAHGQGVELWLELELEAPGGKQYRLAVKLEVVDPYVLAAEIMGAADAVVRQVATDLNLDAQATRETLRKQRLRHKRRREEVAEQVAASGATSCEVDGCRRSVAFVIEGMRLCKRHAEELGVRPTGKVGAPEPGELPEEEE